ncbi:MAG: ShlB/FhaC/HecB family hemolysin secretion/activation protein [Deltaproteobacteria bacterium]|nr:ShlB/FhaC/HecB family hemolysin secretion/activation protein [Deltaproteobacteria bacterium]
MKGRFYTYCVMVLVCCALMSSQVYASNVKTLQIDNIGVIGSTVFGADAFKPILAKYRHRRITFAELRHAASEIASLYRQHGYLLVKAYIPKQKFAANTAFIDVVEGKLGKVIIKGKHPYYSDKFIRNYFAPLQDGKIYSQGKLERALLTLNDFPKLKVVAMLEPGSVSGTSDLVVDANNSRPVSVTLDYNNFGSLYTGRNRFSATLDVGNLLQEGSRLIVRGTTSNRPSELGFGSIDYSLPVGNLGTRVGVTLQKGTYDVGGDLSVLNLNGDIKGYGIYASHPFILRKRFSFKGRIGFNLQDTTQDMMNKLSSEDKIRTVDIGLSVESYDIKGRSFFSLGVSRGMGKFMDGTDNNSFYASRAGAGDSFTKYTASVMRLQRFNDSFYGILRGNGQLANSSLVSSEMFTIGGANSVRGYNWGEHSGDNGFNGTVELRYSPLAAHKDALQLLAFMDYGWVKVKTPAKGQDDSQDLTGTGIGARVKLPHSVSLSADVGLPLNPAHASDGKSLHYYLSSTIKF